MQSVFKNIYDHNLWGSEESVSGRGSEMSATIQLRKELPEIIKRYEIHRIMDVACGDSNWWHEMTFPHQVAYLGVDIVPELIERNINWYGQHGSRRQTTDTYEVMDITRDPLYEADLIFARDVLVHFSNADVKRALNNIKNSRSKYLMATTFPNHENSGDIKTGEWRPINLEKLWGLPKPVLVINERCDIAGFEDKSMALWRLK